MGCNGNNSRWHSQCKIGRRKGFNSSLYTNCIHKKLSNKFMKKAEIFMCNNVPEFSIVSKKPYQLNHLFGQLIFIKDTLFHHKLNMRQDDNVTKRILYHPNNVCQFRATLLFLTFHIKNSCVAALILVYKSNLCISFFILHFGWYQMLKN